MSFPHSPDRASPGVLLRFRSIRTFGFPRSWLRFLETTFARTMTDTAISPFAWWNARRLRYNVALVVAGILAFIAYVAVCVTLLPKEADVDITLFTTLFQGVGYLFMIGVANVCYFIGPLRSDSCAQRTQSDIDAFVTGLAFGFRFCCHSAFRRS